MTNIFSKNYTLTRNNILNIPTISTVHNGFQITDFTSILATVAQEHSTLLGFPTSWFDERQLAWFIMDWHVKFHKFPEPNSTITADTWATIYKRIQSHRSFILKNEHGETILEGMSKWVVLNTATRKLSRATSEIFQPYSSDLASVFPDNTFIQTKLSDEAPIQENSIKVASNHIDSNEHINNNIYIGWHESILSNHISPSNKIVELKAHYHKEAYEGDVIAHSLYDGSADYSHTNSKEFVSKFTKSTDSSLIHCQVSSVWE